MKILNSFFALLFVANMFSQSVPFVNQKNTSKTSKYRSVFHEDPSSSIIVSFEIGIPHANPVFYYSTTDYGQDYTKYENSITTEDLNPVEFGKKGKFLNSGFAKLNGLTPDTPYYFVIKDDQGVSKRFWFKTAPNDNRQMSFISGGDSRGGGSKRRNGNIMVSVLKPTAVFFGGDYNDGKKSAGQWGEWFDDWQLSIAKDGRMFPLVPARGNHDSVEVMSFVFGIDDYNFKTTFGESLLTLFTLDSQIGFPDSQAEWFENEAKSCNSIWKATQYHKPIRPHFSGKTEGNAAYQKWLPIMEKYNFDISFESDTHVLKRTWPIVSCTDEGETGTNGNVCEMGFRRDDDNGIIYVGEGTWGVGARLADDPKAWTRDFARIAQLKWVCISETNMTEHTILHDDTNFKIVTPNDNSGTCAIPTNVSVWSPDNGEVIQLQKSVLSTDEYKLDNVLAVSPNPTKGIVNIKDAKQGFTVRVTALDGANVANRNVVNQKVDIQDLNSGVYILNIFDAKKKLISINKVIKE